MKKLLAIVALISVFLVACNVQQPSQDKADEQNQVVSRVFETDKYTFEFPDGWERIDSTITSSRVTLARDGMTFELHHPKAKVLGMPGYEECGSETFTSRNGVTFELGCNKYIDEQARKEIMFELGPEVDAENHRLVVGSIFDDTFFYTYNEKLHPSSRVDLRRILDSIVPKK